MPKYITTTVYLGEGQLKRLHELREKTKVPMAEVIRRGVEIAIELEEAKVEAWEAIGRDGRGDKAASK